MTSLVDATKPIYGSPTTQSVRNNFAIIGNEISALQDLMAPGPFLPMSGGQVTGPIYLANDPTDPRMPATKAYVDAGGGGPGGGTGIPEAPADGTLYARQDGSWKHSVNTAELNTAVAAAIATVPNEAPENGKSFGRKNKTWIEVLPITGGTLLGLLTLSGAPVDPLHAATKAYTDSSVANYLPLVGGTLSGQLYLDHATGNSALWLKKATKNRWVAYNEATGETGTGNAGSNFRIDRFADDGTSNLGSALVINRATGLTNINGRLVVNNAIDNGSAGLQVSGDFFVGAGSAVITNPSGAVNQLAIIGTGASGAGILLTGNGAITASKYIQVFNGIFRIVNSAYTAEILSLTDTGGLTIGSLNVGNPSAVYPTIVINGAHNTDRQLLFESGGSNRWVIAASGGAGETGSNAGSDLAIGRFSDAQAYLGTPITISRSSGRVTIGSGLVVNGGNLGVGGGGVISTTGQLVGGFGIFGKAGATKGGFVGSWNPTNNDFHGFWSESGSLNFGTSDLAGNPQTYWGGWTSTGQLNLTGPLNSSGYILGTSVYCGDGNFGLFNDGTYKSTIFVGIAWQNRWAISTGNRTWTRYDNFAIMTLDPGGNLFITGQAYKPGGGVWADSSDARIKDVQGDYTQGLDAIIRLKPKVFKYKANERMITPRLRDAPDDAEMPELQSSHFDVIGKDFIGLVAQEVEEFFPEMVTKVPGIIDDERVDDLRVLDTTALIFALLNATRELHDRVLRLEGTA